ncbi:branched-chain amino acid transport system II carrier protein, partial [Lutispora saccharofermentans]
KNMQNIIIIGFALFASFFGAGNLIFPPSIGIIAGNQWLIALAAFVLSGIILPLCSFLAVSKADGTEESIAKELGPIFSKVFVGIIMLCGSILIVIPRTAATTYEIGITPFLPNIPQFIVSLIYFAIVVFFSINQSSAIDKIGKYLTPVLIVMMAIIVIKGIITPIGTPADLGATNVFKNSFIAGYQTLDAIGALAFSGAIISAIEGKEYADIKERRKIAFSCAMVAGLGLLIIYGGLLYIGATGTDLFPADVEKTALLTGLVNKLLGNTGTTILSLAVTFACLTTAIGAMAGAAGFFERVTNHRIKYKKIVIISAIIGVIISSLKVEQIANLAGPLLSIIYPVLIVLIIFGMFNQFLPKTKKGLYAGAVYTTLIISILETLPAFGIKIGTVGNLIAKLPLASIGFSWIIPAIIGGFAGWLLYKNKWVESADSEAF